MPLTIAVPTYNRSGVARSLVESICRQTTPADEVIVSDDGSTDGTAEQASKIRGVKVIRHDKNHGMVANWNACLAAATREWICIIHDDDRLEAGALTALRRACALADGPALIQHEYTVTQFDGRFRYRFSDPGPHAVLNCPYIPSGAVLHRTIVETVGTFDPRFKYSADLEYFPRIAARFPLIVIESPRIVEYRRHGANYHFQVAHQGDFYAQYEELHRLVTSYAGIEDETLKREFLDKRLVTNFVYMLDMAARMGDRSLVRYIAKCCERFPHRFSRRQRAMIRIAAMTGWRPKQHRTEPFEPLAS